MSTAVPTAAAPGTAGRPGYDPDAATARRRVLPMLAATRVAWLSTVTADGRPHLVPTWFLWDGEALLVWSKPDAVKVRNLRVNPRLMVAVGDATEDLAVGLIEADAELVELPVPDAFLDKYAADLAAGALDRETYRSLYTQGVRIRPTRILPWRGRGAAHGLGAARPARTAALGAWLAGRLERVAARLRTPDLGAAGAA